MNFYKDIFSSLEKAGVKYLIVGGVAVNLYGYSRFTGDVDILLALDERNLKKIDGLMRKMGYVERIPVSVKELKDEKKVRKFIKEKNLRAYTFISSHKPQLDIDIIVEESLSFDKYDKRKEIVEVWGLSLPVCHIDDLIDMKKSAGRDKDLIDLKALLKLKES